MALTKFIAKAGSLFLKPSSALARARFTTSAVLRASQDDENELEGNRTTCYLNCKPN